MSSNVRDNNIGPPPKPEDQSPSKKLLACEQAIQRLMNENAAYRESQERVQILVRKRAPKAEGLNYLEVIRHVLDERDKAEDLSNLQRETMKKVKAALMAGEPKTAYEILNLFLLTPPVLTK
jgi:hypothetical protein